MCQDGVCQMLSYWTKCQGIADSASLRHSRIILPAGAFHLPSLHHKNAIGFELAFIQSVCLSLSVCLSFCLRVYVGTCTHKPMHTQLDSIARLHYFGIYRIHSNRCSCPNRHSPPFIIKLLTHKNRWNR